MDHDLCYEVYEFTNLYPCHWTLYGLYLNYDEAMRLASTYLRPFTVLPMLWSTYALELDRGPWTMDIGLRSLLITLINFNYKDLS